MPRNPNFQDLTGMIFGRLTVLGYAGKNKGNRSGYWNCRCVCGQHSKVSSAPLKSGHTQSCGCLQKERSSSATTTHGSTANGQSTAEFRAWIGMKKRCLNPNYRQYHDYGGRGISVHPDWINNFASFLEHVGPRPTANHSLDRIDNSKCYEPGNVRWSDRIAQANNKRSSRVLTVSGDTKTIAEWGRKTGLSPATIWYRIKRGWSNEQAVLCPAQTILNSTSTHSSK